MGALGRHREAGFSLVELLAVLAVLALASGLVVMSLPPGDDTPEDAVRTLAVDLNTTIRQSLYDGHSRALAISDEGWELRRFEGGAWTQLMSGDLSGPVALTVDGIAIELTHELQPLILFEPSGLATPFSLQAGRRADRFTLSGDPTGEITASRDDDS